MNGRILNIISMWEVVTMDERTMESNFMRLAHCVTYGTCRDWLSSENTGLRSPWHYSKVASNLSGCVVVYSSVFRAYWNVGYYISVRYCDSLKFADFVLSDAHDEEEGY